MSVCFLQPIAKLNEDMELDLLEFSLNYFQRIITSERRS